MNVEKATEELTVIQFKSAFDCRSTTKSEMISELFAIQEKATEVGIVLTTFNWYGELGAIEEAWQNSSKSYKGDVLRVFFK